MGKTISTPNHRFMGNGKLDAIVPVPVTFADHNMIKIRFNKAQVAGELPNSMISKATIQVAEASSSASKFILTLRIFRRDASNDGTDVTTIADADVHEFSVTGVAVVSGATQHQVDTLIDLVNAINTVDGFDAAITDGPTDWDLDHATNSVSVAQTELPALPLWLDAVQNDVSVTFAVYKRIGLPEAHHRNALRLMEINAVATGVTAGKLTVFTDDVETGVGANFIDKTLLAAQTAYIGDDILNAPTYMGPLMVKFVSSDLSALTASINYQQATM
jgi:uncharacterized protein YlxP (DUF503 family)